MLSRAQRTGLCHWCAELRDLPYKKDGKYFCSEECLAAYEEETEEGEDE